VGPGGFGAWTEDRFAFLFDPGNALRELAFDDPLLPAPPPDASVAFSTLRGQSARDGYIMFGAEYKASDPAFLTLMQGLYTLASLPQPAGPNAVPPALSDSQFDAAASAAASTISQGLTQLQALTEKNGRNEQFLNDENTAHDATLTVLQTQIDNIEQVNLADASTRLTQLKTQLDASYHVVADLSTLSLIDFLK